MAKRKAPGPPDEAPPQHEDVLAVHRLPADASRLLSQLRRHSFAVVDLGSAGGDTMQRAAAEASALFECEFEFLEKHRRLVKEFHGAGALVGFNQPTPAKLLYRVRPELDQPWPRTPEGFKARTLESYEALRALLEECLDLICKGSWGVRFSHDRGLHTAAEELCEATGYEGCPMDYFKYLNSNDVLQVHNCSEHVDRGLLSVVLCSDVPGLQLLGAQDGLWWTPEDSSEIAPWRHALVMVNQELNQLSAVFSGRDGQIEEPEGCVEESRVLPACVHRVKKNERARLSMSYELRHAAGADIQCVDLVTQIRDLIRGHTERESEIA